MTQEELQQSGDKFVEAIKTKMDEQNLNASGAGAASLSATATDNKILIEGLARLLFLEYGRAPGKMPPIAPLMAWVEKKLNVEPDEVEDVAKRIAKKIEKEGTNIFRDKAKGLQLEIILNELFEELSENVFNFEATILVDNIAAQFNAIK